MIEAAGTEERTLMGLFDWFRQRHPAGSKEPHALPKGVSTHVEAVPEFIGQQIGVAADTLNAEFREALSGFPQVERAYFCRLRYLGEEKVGAALCIVSSTLEDIGVIGTLADVIRTNLASHMDILFLSPAQERDLAKVCQPFFNRAELGTTGETRMSDGTSEGFQNITCAGFLELSEDEQRAFVVGVANGRSMTAGLFEAYAGAAQDMAESAAEREAIAASYQTIRGMLSPLLEIGTASLLNGLKAVCKQAEFRDRFVIEALVSVHLDVVKALRTRREQSDQ